MTAAASICCSPPLRLSNDLPTPSRPSFLRLLPSSSPRLAAAAGPPSHGPRLQLHRGNGTVLYKSRRRRKVEPLSQNAFVTQVPLPGQHVRISCFHLSNRRGRSAQNGRQRVLFDASTSAFNRLTSGKNSLVGSGDMDLSPPLN